jgi:type I restriction enzyme S subunit
VSGWPVAALRDVADIQLGKMLSPAAKRGVRPLPYLRNANVQWNGFDLTDVAEMDFTRVEEAKFLLRKGDVLVVEGGEPGRAAVWDGSIERICYQKAVHRIRPHDDRLDPHFLVYRLWAGATRGEFTSGETKTTIAHLPLVRLKRIGVPLPPIDGQRLIAARLREQLAEVSLVVAAAQARIDQMDRLAQRAIDAAIPPSDEIALESTLRTRLRTGLSRAASATANHRVLTLSSVRNGILDVDQNRPMDATDDEAIANAVRPSTFYVVRGNGSLHMAGAGALSPESIDGVVLYPDLLIQVDPDPALLSVEYLALAWRSNRVRRQVEARLRTSAGIHKVNLANLSTVDVPVPQLDEQRRFAARLHEQLAEIDRAKAAVEAQRKAIDVLPAALLREVFGASPVGG